MAVRQFALRLNDSSIQSGDTTFEKLRDNNLPVVFDLINVVPGSVNQLNLITKKNGVTTNHIFTVDIAYGVAKVELSAAQISAIYDDAGSDWDYIEACWTVGSTDTPITSVMHETQNGNVYDLSGWPPKPVA